jgi:hypothetical protein
MSEEERQRQIEFILTQQAQFAANIQAHDERMAQLEDVVGRLANATLRRFETTDEAIDDTDRKISALVDSQMQTAESIRNLVAIVDRYFSEGSNGKS